MGSEIYFEKYASFNSKLLIIGMGTVGQTILPLIFRHFNIQKERITVIDPDSGVETFCKDFGVEFLNIAVTPTNYIHLLNSLVTQGDLVLQIAIHVDSFDLIKYCWDKNIRYIDASIETWCSSFCEHSFEMCDCCDYEERERIHSIKNDSKGTKNPTIISGGGANPGLVNIFVKKALLDLVEEDGIEIDIPKNRSDWAQLCCRLGVHTIQISERDTQKSNLEQLPGIFFNTWCIDGYFGECMLPSEIAWGTNQNSIPDGTIVHDKNGEKVIHFKKHGIEAYGKTWVPGSGEITGNLITHTESFSISEYFTITKNGTVHYRPTSYFIYLASENAVKSVENLIQSKSIAPIGKHIMKEDIISGGYDEVGVLIMRNQKAAYWFGSTLTIDEARSKVKNTNATALQVAAGVLVSLVYATEHPLEGLLETDDLDYERALHIAKPYLGKLEGYFTEWQPVESIDLKSHDFHNRMVNDLR
jgi:homospermidine synthase